MKYDIDSARVRCVRDYELVRIQILTLLDANRISFEEAQMRLGLSKSHLYKVKADFKRLGPASCLTKKVGYSNRQHPPALRQKVCKILAEKYPDYGPTLAGETLAQRHDIKIPTETLRQWMIAANIWLKGAGNRRKIHQPRLRSSQFGIQWQIDGSLHDWIGRDRAECCLMVCVDDATSRLIALHLTERETRSSYLEIVSQGLIKFGAPVTIVTDRHRAVWQPCGVSKFTDYIAKKGIRHIFAMSPQAKGRVEKMNRTLQDRLVKFLRENGVADIVQANELMPAFIEIFNARFAKTAPEPGNAHLSLTACMITQKIAELRKISKNLTVSVRGKIFLLPKLPSTRQLVGKRIQIEVHDGATVGVLGNGATIQLTSEE